MPLRLPNWVVEGRVAGVSDGDTVTVLDDAKAQDKIRFAGIDAREKAWGSGDLSFALGAREGLDRVRPVLRRPVN